MSKAKLYEMDGEKKCIRKWADQYNVSYPLLCKKLSAGIPLKEAIADLKRKKKLKTIIYRGKEYTITELANRFGMKRETLKSRIECGWSVEDAVRKPIKCRLHMVIIQDKSGCAHYDCLHQDGGGECDLGIKRCKRDTKCDLFEDAYEYYFGNEIKRRNEGEDPWAADRMKLTGYSLNKKDS